MILFAFQLYTAFFRLLNPSFFLQILSFSYVFMATLFSTFLYNLSSTPNSSIQNTILNRIVHYLLVYRPIYNLYPLLPSYHTYRYYILVLGAQIYSSIFSLLSLKYKSVSLLVGFELWFRWLLSSSSRYNFF